MDHSSAGLCSAPVKDQFACTLGALAGHLQAKAQLREEGVGNKGLSAVCRVSEVDSIKVPQLGLGPVVYIRGFGDCKFNAACDHRCVIRELGSVQGVQYGVSLAASTALC